MVDALVFGIIGGVCGLAAFGVVLVGAIHEWRVARRNRNAATRLERRA